MSGETNLDRLLANISPALNDGLYVFCTFERGQYGDLGHLEPIASFRESEGLTLVVPSAKADEYGHAYDATFRWIELRVHSSLEAVGLTAAFAAKLAEYGISANVLAGFFHDHIFVPHDQAERAMTALKELAHTSLERPPGAAS